MTPDWPYGRISWHFDYRPEDHDEGEKTFLGQTGNFNGEDIVEIICQQEATAQFIARHMYHFFVADEPPVPAWPYTPPRDAEAIDTLVKAYYDGGYDIQEMLRALFTSDFFKDESIRYEKVKSPAELVAGVLRLTGEFDRPRREIMDRALQMTFMGQMLNNPPSVEGWHQGMEWVDTGTLVERINFASEQFGDANKPGVRAMIDGVLADEYATSPARIVDTLPGSAWRQSKFPMRRERCWSDSPSRRAKSAPATRSPTSCASPPPLRNFSAINESSAISGQSVLL